ncbi:MAG: hypothetical protein V7L22_34830 [Nostoc sp.]|uniref:hypothetical protein n=1 Tax=unclassified Nostoc TaxID=2593658 RepID=UPI0015C4069F|nr:hypothetical protein [Nostoc sp. C052]
MIANAKHYYCDEQFRNAVDAAIAEQEQEKLKLLQMIWIMLLFQILKVFTSNSNVIQEANIQKKLLASR